MADNNIIEELADLLEVIEAIMKFKHIDPKDIEHIRKLKQEEKWGFDKRIILENTSD